MERIPLFSLQLSVRQAGLFNLGMAIGLGEEKNLSSNPLYST